MHELDEIVSIKSWLWRTHIHTSHWLLVTPSEFITNLAMTYAHLSLFFLPRLTYKHPFTYHSGGKANKDAQPKYPCRTVPLVLCNTEYHFTSLPQNLSRATGR